MRRGAAHAGAASAVTPTDQVGEFAFDLGAGGPVVGFPDGVALAGPGGGEAGFVMADSDAAAGLGVGAQVGERAVAAVATELGLAGLLLVAVYRFDRDGDTVRAGHLLGFEVDVELVLGELPARRDGWLDLRHRLDPCLLQAFQDFPDPVGGVTINRRRLIARRHLIGSGRLLCRIRVGEISDEVGDRLDVTAVAWGDRDRYCYRGRGSLQLWRTVFERRAPTSLHHLEALGCEVRQGNTIYQISDELLSALTCYRTRSR
jgi:hypothetical protein